MEFFFPADVFASFPGQSRRPGPSNPFVNCGFGSQAPFEDFFADAIREERVAEAARARAHAAREAAQARARAAQQAAEIKRAHAARRAAELQQQRAAEEQQLRAYFEHVLGLHNWHEEEARQRQAQREQAQQEYHAQLQRQREQERRAQLQQAEVRRQQYAEYQRQKTYAVQKERERIAAAQAARDNGKQFFLVLEDLLVGGLRALFNDEEPAETTATDSQRTETAQPATATPKDTKGKAKAQDEVSVQQAASVATSTTVSDSDPEELGPVPTAETTEPTPATAEQPILVFEHDFPATGDFDKNSVEAGAINVSVDEEKRTVTVSGLWDNEPADVARASSPTPSSGSGSQRGRSRSPKRARVSDVDENGNEIVTPEQQETDEDFVEVHFHKNDSKPATVQKTFSLPEGAVIDALRAELTDQGLKLYTSKA